jgi:hypothetical protein
LKHYHFFQNLRPTSKKSDWYEPNTIYLNGVPSIYFYYENGLCMSVIHSDKWKFTYSYDIQNNRTEELCQEWKSGQWINYIKVTYTYDSQKNITEKFFQWWEWGEWVNYTINTYLYDSQKNIIEELSQIWLSGQWADNGTYRHLHSYNGQNYRTETIIQHWGSTQWVNGSRYIFTYTAKGNLTELLEQSWFSPGQWSDCWLHTYSYDERDNRIERLKQFWASNKWVTSGKFSYIYDDNNNSTFGFF